jgi:hypothetical protein
MAAPDGLGLCAAKGCTVPAGCQTLNVLVICSIKAEFSAEAAMVFQAEADVIPYKTAGAKCGQATGREVRLGYEVLRWHVWGQAPDAERAGHRLGQVGVCCFSRRPR